MLCHGELVRLKPEPARLTSFYLTLAAGGACGGLFVGLVAPQIFPTYLELPLAMLGTTGLVLAALFRDPASWFYRGRPRWAWACLAVMTLALVAGLVIQFEQSLQGIHAIQRNFYGVLQVKLEAHNPAQNDYICHLIHGRTLHGLQFTREDRRRLATSYYGPQSGVGLVFAAQPAGIPRRIGLVGLGIGTLAAYGRPGDTFRFYEINPASIRLAREFFLYLDDCPARVEIVPGDARLSLEREAPQQFDLLVLDAFSSDAIPLHLLTREALAIYLRHLQPDGVLAVHISNVYLDIRPVLAGWAAHADLQMATIHSAGQEDDGTRTALWVLLSRSAKALQVPAIQKDQLPPETRRIDWTDDRNSLFEALK
jgi:predicted O-methyltransferase YrrM